MNLKFDCMIRKNAIGLGINMGSNYKKYGRVCNFYIEIDVLMFTFGAELNWAQSITR